VRIQPFLAKVVSMAVASLAVVVMVTMVTMVTMVQTVTTMMNPAKLAHGFSLQMIGTWVLIASLTLNARTS
jgi:hypothetical protein